MNDTPTIRDSSATVFGVDVAEAARLREAATFLSPSPVIFEPERVFDYGRQHEIPKLAMELYGRTRSLGLSQWEQEAIRVSLNSPNGALRQLIEMKAARQGSKDPRTAYIRVDCFGKRVQSPCLLEIWPGGHYSPIHEHANSTGLVKALHGRVDIMFYDGVTERPKEIALLTMTEGSSGWMTPAHYQVHRVYCPMSPLDFAATFHIYIDTQGEHFRYREDAPPYVVNEFLTESDITWGQFYKGLTDSLPYFPE